MLRSFYANTISIFLATSEDVVLGLCWPGTMGFSDATFGLLGRSGIWIVVGVARCTINIPSSLTGRELRSYGLRTAG